MITEEIQKKLDASSNLIVAELQNELNTLKARVSQLETTNLQPH